MSACGCCGEYNGEHDQYCSVTQVSKLETLLSQEQARGRRLMKILQKVTVSRYPKSLAIAALAEEEAGK